MKHKHIDPVVGS